MLCSLEVGGKSAVVGQGYVVCGCCNVCMCLAWVWGTGVVYERLYGRGGCWSVCGLQVNGCRCYWRRDGTYLGVVAVVLRSRCVVLCTACEFVSDWHGHVRGWEGSMARRSRGFGSPQHCSGISFPSLWRKCI